MPRSANRTARQGPRIIRPWRARHLPLVALFLVAAACTDGAGQGAADETTAVPHGTSNANSAETTVADQEATTIAGTDDFAVLPVRDGPRKETTYSVPHIQIDAEPVPEVNAELRRRAFSLPALEDRESELSLPGARSLWLADDVELARPDVPLAGREIGHIHPDGSLHILLPVDRARQVAETKWGELHPWVGRDDVWDGLVMVYTPETIDDVEIIMQLIVDAYNFVSGADLDPGDFS